jgi:hypothetical protein
VHIEYPASQSSRRKGRIPPIGLLTIPLAQITISWGDPREFMRNYLRAMRGFSWYATDNETILKAYEDLEKIYNNPNTMGEEGEGLI